MRIALEIEGGEDLARRLRGMGDAAEAILEAAALAGAALIARAANERAPAPLIQAEVAERGRGRVSVAIGPPEDRWYWRFLETGAQPHRIRGRPLLVWEGPAGPVFARRVAHPGMAAKPFLRPAFDEERERARDAVAERLRGALR